MAYTHLRRARVEELIFAESTIGETDVLQPGEYFVEDAGNTVRLHLGPNKERALTEVAAPVFDAWLTGHQLVFLSWS
jgi:hypothetical protein